MTVQRESTSNSWPGDPGKEQLLEPGWAGELSPEELTHIKSELKKSPSLRRRWGFRPTARRLSEKKIRAVARDGLPRRSQF